MIRKLHLQMQMSVDGFVSTGPNHEQQWVTLVWEEIRPYVIGLLDATSTVAVTVPGRRESGSRNEDAVLHRHESRWVHRHGG